MFIIKVKDIYYAHWAVLIEADVIEQCSGNERISV
jgi:hypothetical protein